MQQKFLVDQTNAFNGLVAWLCERRALDDRQACVEGLPELQSRIDAAQQQAAERQRAKRDELRAATDAEFRQRLIVVAQGNRHLLRAGEDELKQAAKTWYRGRGRRPLPERATFNAATTLTSAQEQFIVQRTIRDQTNRSGAIRNCVADAMAAQQPTPAAPERWLGEEPIDLRAARLGDPGAKPAPQRRAPTKAPTRA